MKNKLFLTCVNHKVPFCDVSLLCYVHFSCEEGLLQLLRFLSHSSLTPLSLLSQILPFSGQRDTLRSVFYLSQSLKFVSASLSLSPTHTSSLSSSFSLSLSLSLSHSPSPSFFPLTQLFSLSCYLSLSLSAPLSQALFFFPIFRPLLPQNRHSSEFSRHQSFVAKKFPLGEIFSQISAPMINRRLLSECEKKTWVIIQELLLVPSAAARWLHCSPK